MTTTKVRTCGQLEHLDALRVPSDVCTMCGQYSDEAHHGDCIVRAEASA